MKVLLLLSDANVSSSFYRGMGPWSALAKKHREVQLLFSQRPTVDDVRLADLVFMLRPCTANLQVAAQACKDWGVPLWVDYDDQVLNVPSDNPSWGVMGQPQVRQTVIEYLRAADLVTVSTKKLAEVWSEHSSKIEVLPNALDEALYRFRPPGDGRHRVVLWRGTGTHERDVGHVHKGFVETARMFPNYTYLFFGSDPAAWLVSEEMERAGATVQRLFQQPLSLYFKTMAVIRPEVVVAPLYDNEFNRCKSNIAAIEGAYAGGCVVAPDWEEWRLPGVVNYKDPHSFGDALQRVLKRDFDAAARADETMFHVEHHLMLTITNLHRWELAKEVTGRIF